MDYSGWLLGRLPAIKHNLLREYTLVFLHVIMHSFVGLHYALKCAIERTHIGLIIDSLEMVAQCPVLIHDRFHIGHEQFNNGIGELN